jgi:hypothetical protein
MRYRQILDVSPPRDAQGGRWEGGGKGSDRECLAGRNRLAREHSGIDVPAEQKGKATGFFQVSK